MLEAKDYNEALGLGDDIKTKEQLIESLNKKFITVSSAHDNEEVRSRVVGRLNGSLTTKVKSLFGLESEEIKDKKIEEVIDLAHSKLKKRLEELEDTSKKTKDQSILDLESKYEKARKETLDYKSAAEKAALALSEKEGAFEKEKKGWKIDGMKSAVFAELNKELRTDISPLEKEGFDSHLSKNFIFDLDENGSELAVFDKEGKRIPDPKKLGAFLSAKDLLTSEAAKNKLIKMNSGSTQTALTNIADKKNVDNKKTIDLSQYPKSVRERMEKNGVTGV